MRIQSLDPYDGCDPPEETVQEIDPSAQVEGDFAVIPEYLPEYDLTQNAAHIFIGPAQESADEKNMPVRLVTVFVEEDRRKDDGKAPYDTERAPYETAPAHPDSGGNTAENGLCDVAEKRSDQEEPEQFVETAALCEMSLLEDLFRPFLDNRVGFFHTPFYIADYGKESTEEQIGKFSVLTAGRPLAVLQMEYSGQGYQCVSRKIDHQTPYENVPEGIRDQTVQEEKESIPVPEGGSAQYSPKKGIRKADIAVEIPFLL